MLISLDEAKELIEKGKKLVCAASEDLLKKLPKGNWIGGTTPYFMGVKGGTKSSSEVFVTELPDSLKFKSIEVYDVNNFPSLVDNTCDNGISFLLLPAFSEIHREYSERAPEIDMLFEKNIVGWIAGFDLSSKDSASVVNGLTGEVYKDKAIVFHTSLEDGKTAEIKIKNIFEQGDGDTITFTNSGFSCKTCLVNGEEVNFAKYIKDNNIDIKLPLVADFFGTGVNVSFMSVEDDEVKFYAPVFDAIDYKIAKPIDNYAESFKSILNEKEDTVFCCNCILNYLYGELENKTTGNFTGPIVFGEIAYQLVNQTLVYVTIK